MELRDVIVVPEIKGGISTIRPPKKKKEDKNDERRETILRKMINKIHRKKI